MLYKIKLTCAAHVWVSTLYTLVTVRVGALAASILTTGTVLTAGVIVAWAASHIAGPDILTETLNKLCIISI